MNFGPAINQAIWCDGVWGARLPRDRSLAFSLVWQYQNHRSDLHQGDRLAKEGCAVLKVGMIGAGNMARIHAAAFARTGKAQIAGVYALDQVAAAELAGLYDARAAASAQELLASDLDAVVIATPTHTHVQYLELAHAAGVHILCEKPLVRTTQELLRTEQLFAGSSKVVMVGHTVRFFPEYAYARTVLRQGELGQCGVLRLGRCAGFRLPADHWLCDFDKSGGVVLDMMIHDLDFVEWAAGPLESVFARHAAAATPADDLCLVVGRLRDGGLVHIEASWAEPPDTFYYFYELAASAGILDYDSRRAPAFCWRPRRDGHCFEPAAVALTPAALTPYDRQAAAFVDAVLAGEVPPVTLADGAWAVRLALAVLRSADTGEVVEV
jgi:predicted dehydrogenase